MMKLMDFIVMHILKLLGFFSYVILKIIKLNKKKHQYLLLKNTYALCINPWLGFINSFNSHKCV